MMLRGRSYTSYPYNEELYEKRKKKEHRIHLDNILLCFLFFLIGVFSTVVYLTYYPLP